ncbi:class D sortase [Priestia megaterium]
MKHIGAMLLIIGIILTTYCSYTWIHQRNVVSHFNKNELEEQDLKVYKKTSFKNGEQIANLFIPSIQRTYPVFLGTDPDVLKKGAGMYKSRWTTFPSEKGHTVISGHRDTVFRDLRYVKKGETLVLFYQGGQYKYEVQKIWITDKDNRGVITKKNHSVLTLTTCYPFYYIGNAPKRYVIEATLQKLTKYSVKAY